MAWQSGLPVTRMSCPVASSVAIASGSSDAGSPPDGCAVHDDPFQVHEASASIRPLVRLDWSPPVSTTSLVAGS